MKISLITGITGQDGSYLSELLISKGYEVHGIIRRTSTFNTQRIDHIYVDPHEREGALFLHHGDLSNSEQLSNVIYNLKPAEIYHLGAQSHVRVSFDMAEYTGDITALGTTRVFGGYKKKRDSDEILSSIEQRDVRQRPIPSERKNTFPAAEPLCGSEALFVLDGKKLQGWIWYVHLQRHTL